MAEDLSIRTEKIKFPNRPARMIEVDFYKDKGNLKIVHDKTGRVMAQWDLNYKKGFPENPSEQFFKGAIEDCVLFAKCYDYKYKYSTRNAISELNPVKIVKDSYNEMIKFFERKIDMFAMSCLVSSPEEAARLQYS